MVAICKGRVVCSRDNIAMAFCIETNYHARKVISAEPGEGMVN
jgi:hypothetical protein